MASPTGVQLAGWTYVGTAPAHGESEYGLVSPTLADATTASTEYSAFFARAVTSDPFTFFDSAVDRNGNESAYALVGPGQTTDVADVPAVSFAVHGVSAGPSAHGRMTVDFSLPNATPARPELLDVSGRRLGSIDVGALGIGRHQATVVPDATLHAGVYFVRLRQGTTSRTMRTVLLP